ncbi:uncharacterized protein KZ484_025301 [Pholidichthys leucotaenia]
MPPPLLSPPQQSAEWCGPDGSVVLIRAVRSGLDRVVLELLRAGVPVNNTDHTGRSALHWACSVNHLSLARTLIRYGAAVDLQDNKGETALFLSALHGCYDTARLLLLHGANLELHDRRGRCPVDVAREGMHDQVLDLLLAHQIQRRPITVESPGDVMWEERTVMYSPWVGLQGLPGRSASFSGIIAHRDMTQSPQNDWSMGRVQYPPPQNWRPQLNQSATAFVPPRVMGRSPPPNQYLAGGDLRGRGSGQAPGRPQGCHPPLPVAPARPPAALLLLHPAHAAAPLQQSPARSQLSNCDRQSSQRARREGGRFPSHRHGRRHPARSPACCKRQWSKQNRAGKFDKHGAETQRRKAEQHD